MLALKGLRQYKRTLLLPWLIFYAVMLALAFAVFLTSVFRTGLRWHLLLLGFVALMMFTRWRHINLQFKLMGMYPERPTQQSFSDLAAVVQVSTSAQTTNASNAGASDLFKNNPPPPKYEDLEQPPNYEDIETSPSAAAGGAAGAAALVPQPQRNPAQMETELANLESVVSALDGQEQKDCQDRIDQLKCNLRDTALRVD